VEQSENLLLAKNFTGPGAVPTVSEMLPLHFRGRCPKYFKQRQKAIDVNGKQAHDPNLIVTWFSKSYQVCQELCIEACNFWNDDETGFLIGMGKDYWVLTRDQERPSYLECVTNCELVTVIEWVHGRDKGIPPMVILPGKIHQEH
jgi:hypothetical protein